MKAKEIYRIVHKNGNHHYDTNEEKFLTDNWNGTLDSKKYLKMLIVNNPEKFKDCTIVIP